MHRPRSLLALLIACASAGSAALPPKLAVVISIDQLRYDHIDRYEPYFSEGGFRRMRAGGLDFRDAHYRHGVTKTAPGHALILSGVHANVHGIVGNTWVEPGTWQAVASVEDADSPLVGAEARPGRSPGGVLELKEGRSPRRFHATTVGDGLKVRHGDRARVISLANKDRSAILMGGRMADGVYWIERGRFVTSTFYRPALPAWVEAFNAEKRVEAVFGTTWERLLPPEVYAAAGPDDAPGEGATRGLGATFPKKIDGGKPAIDADFYEAFLHAPAATELVGAFAKEAIKAEQLGRHDGPDLLCVGFSQIDYVGHAYGPDSQEVMDSLVRLDRVLADLLRFLDQEVGEGAYTVVLTADHGVAPLPERVKAFDRDVPAGRLPKPAFDAAVRDALDRAFGPLGDGLKWTIRDGLGYHFYPEALAAKGIASAAAEEIVRKALLTRPEVRAVYTRADFAQPGLLDPMGEGMRLSYHPDYSPAVVFVPHPFFIDMDGTGSNHGSPYSYDTHVPLLWFGAGVPSGRRPENVGVDDLTPTLANLLGIPAPPQAAGRVLF